MRTRTLFPTLLAAAAFALAGCGGDDDDDNGGSATGGNAERPAETIMADAGLQICGEGEDQLVQSIGDEGAQNVQAFAVAKNCGGKTASPNTITVVQYDSIDARDAAANAASTGLQGSVVMTSGALMFVSSGPDAEANADAVGKAYEDTTGSPVETVAVGG